MIKAESFISERVIWRGMVRPEAAARGPGDVKDGLEERYVLSGLACCSQILVLLSKRRGERKIKAALSMAAYLNTSFEGQEGVAGVAHLEDTPKPIGSNVADFQNLEIRRDRTQIELGYDDVVDNNGRLGRLIESSRQHLAGALVEACISRKGRPIEVERHGGGGDAKRR